MPSRAIATVVCCAALAGLSVTHPGDDAEGRSVVVTDDGGEALATVPLEGDSFAVSYRNSIYRTLAEERYEVRTDGSYELEQIAAEQLAVLEEYYGVPGAPRKAPESDRRRWVVAPDPAHPAVFTDLSIAATDLGERVLHVPGSEPVELWRLVDDSDPYLSIDIKENS